MKILYHHRIRSKDGQYVQIEELTEALRARGHEIVLVGPKAVETEDFGADAGFVDVLKDSLPGFVYEALEFMYSFFAWGRICYQILRHRPDCIYERYSLFSPAGIWAKGLFGLPLLLEVNAPLYAERKKYSGIALDRLARWSEAFTWRGCDHALPVTRVLAGHLTSVGVGEKRITVIPNGVNPARLANLPSRPQAKSRLGLDSKLVLGFVGFIHDWHGLSQVVELLHTQRDADLHLLILGEGPGRAAIERRAAELGVADRFHFTGIVQRNEVGRYLAAFDIALQPAVTPYASPLKLFEYLYLGLPIVAPATDNIREILEDRVNALLFEPDSPEAFCQAVRTLCTDPALRARLGAEAKSTIERRDLTWAHNAQRVEALFSGLLDPATQPERAEP